MRTILHMLPLLLLVTAAYAVPAFKWQPGPDMPSARDHLGCGVIDGMLIVAGGAYWKDDKKGFAADAIAYSPAIGKWTRLPYLPEHGAYGASAVYQNQLLIAGGANETGALKSCFRLMTKDGVFHWKRLPDLPVPIAGGKGAVVGNRFLVIGGAPGMDEAGIRAASSALLELNLSNPRAWKVSELPKGFSPRIGAAVATVGSGLFVFGGYGVQPDGTLGNFGDAWIMQGGVWKRIKDMPIPTRWATAVALDSRYIGLFGGYGKGFLANTYVYGTARDAYMKSTDLPMPVCNLAAGESGYIIYLAGGEDKERHRSAALFIGKFTAP